MITISNYIYTKEEIYKCIKHVADMTKDTEQNIIDFLCKIEEYKEIKIFFPTKIQLSKKSWLDVFIIPKNFINFDELMAIKPEQRGKVKIMGKDIDVPRYQKTYGKNYTFSGIKHIADPIPDILEKVRLWTNGLGYGFFNQVLVNWYDDGNSYIGKHSDDERELIKGSPVFSISLGAERNFRIRPKKDVNALFEGNFYDIMLKN